MDNLNKLLKYLVNTNDIEKLSKESGVDAGTIEKICVDIFTKLIPSDFTRSEGAHIEKKDLTAITTNFNNLLSGAALKELIGSIVTKYDGVDASTASNLVKQILVIIRSKLQFMTAAKKQPKPAPTPVTQPVSEEPKETLKKELVEEKEEVSEVKPQTRIEKRHPEEKPQAAKIIKEEVVEENEDEDLSKGEKIALYVVGGLLIAVIVVIVVVLIKINV